MRRRILTILLAMYSRTRRHTHTHTPLFRSYLTSLVFLSSLSTLWLSHIDIENIHTINTNATNALYLVMHSLSRLFFVVVIIFLLFRCCYSQAITISHGNSIEMCLSNAEQKMKRWEQKWKRKNQRASKRCLTVFTMGNNHMYEIGNEKDAINLRLFRLFHRSRCSFIPLARLLLAWFLSHSIHQMECVFDALSLALCCKRCFIEQSKAKQSIAVLHLFHCQHSKTCHVVNVINNNYIVNINIISFWPEDQWFSL